MFSIRPGINTLSLFQNVFDPRGDYFNFVKAVVSCYTHFVVLPSAGGYKLNKAGYYCVRMKKPVNEHLDIHRMLKLC